jgi:hypothetical protein
MALTGVAQAANPYAKSDRSWIGVNGIVAAADEDSFVLDYGEGLITVEMDDWDWYQEGKAILEGDKVSVYGKIDNDLYEAKTIEASSVYVQGLNTYFFASAADEEIDPMIGIYNFTLPSEDSSRVDLTGMVKTIDGRKFTLDTGPTDVTIDTKGMKYNPLDKNGYQKLEKGDLVKVGGYLDLNFFDKKEIQARSVVTLDHDDGKSGS